MASISMAWSISSLIHKDVERYESRNFPAIMEPVNND